jgi:hypothetical protein
MKRNHYSLFSFFLATLLMAGCGPIVVVHERNAVVDAPTLPSRTGPPLTWGQLRVAAELNPVLVAPTTRAASKMAPHAKYGYWYEDPDTGETDYYVYASEYTDHSSSLMIPKIQAGGSIYYGVTNYFEAGIHGHAGPRRTHYKTLEETRDYPAGKERNTWRLGVGVRANIPIKKTGLTLSFLHELNIAKISEFTIETGTGQYTGIPYETEEEAQLAWNSMNTWVVDPIVLRPVLGFQADFQFNPWLHGYLFAMGQVRTKNVHLSEKTYSDWLSFLIFNSMDRTSLESYLVANVGGGLEARLSSAFLNVAMFYPLHKHLSDFNQGPALFLQAGANFGLLD